MYNNAGDSLCNRPFSQLSTSVTLTLALDRVMWHTVVYHSSTSIYTPNFVEISEQLLWTDIRTDRH